MTETTLEPRLLEAIVRSATDYAIISMDARNAVTTWSDGAQDLLGWSAEEMIGQSAAIVFTPEDRERNAPEQEIETARTKGRAEDERWHVRKDGSRFWGSGVLVPLKEGAPPGFLKIMRDRTNEREAAITLQQSEQRFHTPARRALAKSRRAHLGQPAVGDFHRIVAGKERRSWLA